MTIVIPGWAIILGVLSLVDGTPAPTALPPDAPLEFWVLFWGFLIIGFLITLLVHYLLQKTKP